MATKIGSVREIWRYPVKSMTGERLGEVELGPGGLPGDRAWAVRDEVRGGIRGAKKIPGLMRCASRYPEPPRAERSGPAEITLPDGARFLSDAPDASTRLSKALEHEVTLWPLQPVDRLDHYRRVVDHADIEVELREIFGRMPDEPLPDLSELPPELMEYESLPGTYFDALPLLVMTDASLRKLQSLAPRSRIDIRRFRPNFLFETMDGAARFVESEWVGKQIRIGRATIEVQVDCPRCVMVTHGFDDLPKDPDVLRTIVREADQNLGVYATIVEPGMVALGDPVELA